MLRKYVCKSADEDSEDSFKYFTTSNISNELKVNFEIKDCTYLRVIYFTISVM